MLDMLLSKFSGVDYESILLAFVFSLVIGLFISAVYRLTFTGVMYSHSFAVSIVAMTMITNIAILAVTQSVVLSLGMVGALSIVRFRTAVKEPMEIAYLFWAISEGIVIGAGMLPVALIGCALIGAVLLVYAAIGGKSISRKPYILILHVTDEKAEAEAQKELASFAKRRFVKAKTVSDAGIELTVGLRLSGKETVLVNALKALEGISDVTLVSYNGDYMS